MNWLMRRIYINGHALSCWLLALRSWCIERRWLRQWPNHCPSCGGWGGMGYADTYYEPGGYDVCEHYAAAEVCHRCGDPGLTAAGAGPCIACGWDYDDGLNPDAGLMCQGVCDFNRNRGYRENYP